MSGDDKSSMTPTLDNMKVTSMLVSMSMADTIRKAIESSGMTRYELAKRTGVSQATLSKFVHGKVSITVDIADKLAVPLGLQLVLKRSSKSKSKGR